MKVKQHTLLSFEFLLEDGNSDSLSSYIEKNKELLKNHLLVFKTELSDEIKQMLKEKSICYVNRDKCSLNMRKKKVVPFDIDINSIYENNKENNDSDEVTKFKIGNLKTSSFRGTLNRPLRSGELIDTDQDIVILARMNSGSEIISTGNIEIFGIIDGKIECNGSYMILSRIGDKGNVIFNGIILDKLLFRSKQPKIIKLTSDGKLKIEEFM